MLGSRDAFSDWLIEYTAAEENVVAVSRASISHVLGQKPGPLEVVRHFYRDKLRGLRAENHAYSETGSLHTAVLLHRGTVKELFPVPTREAAEALIGLPLDVLQWLVDERLVLLMVQRPERYRHLDFLHPLLKSSFPPACYELRDRAIYDWLSAGEYDRYLAQVRGHERLFGRPFPPALQEPYERLIDDPSERWLQRNHQRYAALVAIMGRDALDDVLALPSRLDVSDAAVRAAQRRFFFLHRYLIHPITQGLGGLPYVAALNGDYRLRTDWASLGAELEQQLGDAVVARLPRYPTQALIEEVQASTLPDDYEAIERRLLDDSVWESVEAGAEARAQATDVVSGLESLADEFDAKYIGRTETLLRVAGIGGAISLAKDAPVASVALGAAGAVPKSAVAAVVDSVHRVFRRRHLPWQYWHLIRTAEHMPTGGAKK